MTPQIYTLVQSASTHKATTYCVLKKTRSKETLKNQENVK